MEEYNVVHNDVIFGKVNLDVKYNTKLKNLSKSDIKKIINLALANGNYHEPETHENKIFIDVQTDLQIYGKCLVSLHSNYHDEEYTFLINNSTVQIYTKEFISDYKAPKFNYEPIYNIGAIVDFLREKLYE